MTSLQTHDLATPTDVLQVLRWDTHNEGHDARSQYAEQFWLPTLGPTALLVLRNIARRLQQEPSGFQMDISQTSAELGLGYRTGNSSPLRKALKRLVQFQLAAFDGAATVAVRDQVPPLAERHERRLPTGTQRRLAIWKLDFADRRFDPVAKSALRLAATTPVEAAVERALFDEGHHPALCFAAAHWACDIVRNIPTIGVQ